MAAVGTGELHAILSGRSFIRSELLVEIEKQVLLPCETEEPTGEKLEAPYGVANPLASALLEMKVEEVVILAELLLRGRAGTTGAVILLSMAELLL